MALKASTGLRNYVLETGALRDALDLGFIDIYNGTPPASADDAIGSLGTNTLLVRISNNSTATGLTFAAAAASGTIEKESSETWAGTAVASGTATFYRHVSASDTGASSTTESRLQGTVANAGAELNMSDANIVLSASQKIDYYLTNLPTA